MAWTIAVTIAVVAISLVLLLVSYIFDKNSRGIKTLALMMAVAVLNVIAGVMGVIIEDNATGTALTHLRLLYISALVITITTFLILILYFFITYMKDYFEAMKHAKEGITV